MLYTISTKVGKAILLVKRLVLITYITVVILSQWVIMAELWTLSRPLIMEPQKWAWLSEIQHYHRWRAPLMVSQWVIMTELAEGLLPQSKFCVNSFMPEHPVHYRL